MRARVAIAHEWLVRYAGSEQCVEEMLRVFPDADLLTALVEPAAVPEALRRARPSLLQRLPGAATHHEWLLPAMPLAWRLRRPLQDVDAVISSSHACAKGVRARPGIPHLCYCHTPMRYAWYFDAERARFPKGVRPVARAGMAAMRRWDRSTSRRVTRFLANSRAVARRIADVYGRNAAVLHPPVRTEFFTPGGEVGDHFVFVGRLVAYKRPDLVIEAFAGLGHPLIVVGDGQMASALRSTAPANVTFLDRVDDAQLRSLYRSARALVYPAEEDFGIVMAEAQACGTPVIALAAGGALDIVRDGRTGWLLQRQDVSELRRLIRRAAGERPDAADVRASAERFSSAAFREGIRMAVEEMIRDPRPV